MPMAADKYAQCSRQERVMAGPMGQPLPACTSGRLSRITKKPPIRIGQAVILNPPPIICIYKLLGSSWRIHRSLLSVSGFPEHPPLLPAVFCLPLLPVQNPGTAVCVSLLKWRHPDAVHWLFQDSADNKTPCFPRP